MLTASRLAYFVCFLISLSSASAQKVGDQIVIFFHDSAQIVDTLIEMTDHHVTINSEILGEKSFFKGDIDTSTLLNSSNPKFHYRVRSIILETAETLRKGERVYQNHQLSLQTFSFGISDKLTLHTGMEMVTLFSGQPNIYVTPKYQLYHSGKFSFAAGTSLIFILNTDNIGFGGSLFGVASLGNERNIFSFGMGLPFVSDRLANSVFIQLSNVYNISQKFGLAAEFILTPNLSRLIGDYTDEFVLGNVMLRYKWEKVHLDVGVYTATFRQFLPGISVALKLNQSAK